MSRIGRPLAGIAVFIVQASLGVCVGVSVGGTSGGVLIVIVIVSQRRQLQGEAFFLTDQTFDRVKGNAQVFIAVAEGQGDVEACVAKHQVFAVTAEDQVDGLRIFFLEVVG
ncbi:MAG: Uncharacterised protein [Rhodospirillaceae bacterium]|nr:MAG: Uncharacterised protein [Rhodospirillaceae bacterium]